MGLLAVWQLAPLVAPENELQIGWEYYQIEAMN
jgi:hypothetical protein